MFDFTANLAEYVKESPYLSETLTAGKADFALLGQMLIGFVGQMYVIQIFFFLQLGKLSLNNVNWIVDILGHFCNDGRPIEEDRKLATKFCGSKLHDRVLSGLAGLIKYHVGLLTELHRADVGLHDFLSDPDQYFVRIAAAEKDYREKTDPRDTFRHT